MKYQNEVNPIQKPAFTHLHKLCHPNQRYRTKEILKVVIQHIQLPCGEEESQKHEAHLNRKY